jgi:hypothetical protein
VSCAGLYRSCVCCSDHRPASAAPSLWAEAFKVPALATAQFMETVVLMDMSTSAHPDSTQAANFTSADAATPEALGSWYEAEFRDVLPSGADLGRHHFSAPQSLPLEMEQTRSTNLLAAEFDAFSITIKEIKVGCLTAQSPNRSHGVAV